LVTGGELAVLILVALLGVASVAATYWYAINMPLPVDRLTAEPTASIPGAPALDR